MSRSERKSLIPQDIYEMAMTDFKSYLDTVSHPVEMPPLDRQLVLLMRKYNVQDAGAPKTLAKVREYFLAGMLVIGGLYFVEYPEAEDEEALDRRMTTQTFAAVVAGERVLRKHKSGAPIKIKAFEKVLTPIVYRMAEHYYNIWLDYFQQHHNKDVFYANLNEALQTVFATWDEIGDLDSDLEG